MEGFYKKYENYPFLLGDSISLANLGGDFGVIGNEPVTSTSEGRSYGIEFLAQKKLNKFFMEFLLTHGSEVNLKIKMIIMYHLHGIIST